MPKEAMMALKHINLIAPLLPPGKLAVVMNGSPSRSSHINAQNLLIEAASKHSAHRREGVAAVVIHFGYAHPSNVQHSAHSREFIIAISNTERDARKRRMLLLLVAGCFLYRITFVLGKRI